MRKIPRIFDIDNDFESQILALFDNSPLGRSKAFAEKRKRVNQNDKNDILIGYFSIIFLLTSIRNLPKKIL